MVVTGPKGVQSKNEIEGGMELGVGVAAGTYARRMSSQGEPAGWDHGGGGVGKGHENKR